MGQEFTINSSAIETKINQLLPSQGGAGAGIDFSASTMIVPIVDLTESAEGSNVRQDLQTALSFNDITAQQVINQTTTMIDTTGYYRVFGSCNMDVGGILLFQLNDGATTKNFNVLVGLTSGSIVNIDFVVFLGAGESLICSSEATTARFQGCTKQIADVNGNLTNVS